MPASGLPFGGSGYNETLRIIKVITRVGSVAVGYTNPKWNWITYYLGHVRRNCAMCSVISPQVATHVTRVKEARRLSLEEVFLS